MKNWSARYKITGVLLVIGALTVAFQPTDIYFLIKKNFTIFSETYENVALEYVDEVDPEVLMRNGIDAMLETLDPYTLYYNESQNEQAEILSRSNYAGIGIEAGYRDGQVVVVAPTEGGPADNKGIRAGDVILSIDGVMTEGLQPDEVQNLTMGEIGSTVTLTIQRFGFEQPLEFEIERKSIEVKNVTYADRIGTNNDIGFIRLAQFGMNSGDEIRDELLALNADGNMQGLILDLRDNPGGILQEAVKIIDKFVEPGITVVETRGRIAEYNQSYETQEPVLYDKPVIILMNGGSASASEVVAGALQDLDRAVILGERSFGKGLVQIVKPMPYNTSLKITISRYYTPSGRSIQSVAYTHNARNASINREEIANRIFNTRNGRPVKEGRGIEPDIEKETETAGLLEVALYQQGSIFDFATQFESENDSYTAASLSDDVYNQFLDFLTISEFNMNLEEQYLLEELQAGMEGIESAGPHIAGLQDAIEVKKQRMFEEHESLIREILFLELVSRYNGQTERTKASLQFDDQLQDALTLITDISQIESILSGNN
ncbi:MAG: S41 family peptidase [Balneolaceae bacterium]|nr:S41 family peptidase [Balneolaceae bacterium]